MTPTALGLGVVERKRLTRRTVCEEKVTKFFMICQERDILLNFINRHMSNLSGIIVKLRNKSGQKPDLATQSKLN